MRDDRKKEKTGSLGLSQSHARDLATGIGQSKTAAMMTGAARSARVAECIPEFAKKALKGVHSGYPEPNAAPVYAIDPYGPTKTAAVQTKVNGRLP